MSGTGIKDSLYIASIDAPTNGANGQLIRDASDDLLKTWNGVSWVPIGLPGLDLIPYSEIRVGTSFPSSSVDGDTFYNTSTKKMYRSFGGSWFEFNWQELVKAAPEFKINRLRIQNNQLQISPDGINWYDCIPAVGASIFEIKSFDNSSYTNLYYILPGTTVILKNANHVPIVFSQALNNRFNMQVQGTIHTNQWLGLRVNNVGISGGDGQYLLGRNTTVAAGRASSLNIVPFIISPGADPQFWRNVSSGTIHTVGNRIIANTLGNADYIYDALAINSYGTMTAQGYWLGTWFVAGGTQVTMSNVSLTRRA